MREVLLLFSLAIVTAHGAAGQPTAGGGPVATEPVTVDVTRAIGGFDAPVLRRQVRTIAAGCRRRGASGAAHLTLALHDQPDRRGMRVTSATGDAGLRRCLRRALPAARWPTGRLDGYAEFTVAIVVARPD